MSKNEIKDSIKEKMYDAKMGLIDLANISMGEFKVNNDLVQRRIVFALEAIDDYLQNEIRF